MFLSHCKLVQLNADNSEGAVIFAAADNQKSVSIGSSYLADVVLPSQEASSSGSGSSEPAMYCHISADAFGRISIGAGSGGQGHHHQLLVNGQPIKRERPLLTASRIQIGGHTFRWDCAPPPKTELTVPEQQKQLRPLTPTDAISKSAAAVQAIHKTVSYSEPARTDLRAKKSVRRVQQLAAKKKKGRFTIFTRCPEAKSGNDEESCSDAVADAADDSVTIVDDDDDDDDGDDGDDGDEEEVHDISGDEPINCDDDDDDCLAEDDHLVLDNSLSGDEDAEPKQAPGIGIDDSVAEVLQEIVAQIVEPEVVATAAESSETDAENNMNSENVAVDVDGAQKMHVAKEKEGDPRIEDTGGDSVQPAEKEVVGAVERNSEETEDNPDVVDVGENVSELSGALEAIAQAAEVENSSETVAEVVESLEEISEETEVNPDVGNVGKNVNELSGTLEAIVQAVEVENSSRTVAEVLEAHERRNEETEVNPDVVDTGALETIAKSTEVEKSSETVVEAVSEEMENNPDIGDAINQSTEVKNCAEVVEATGEITETTEDMEVINEPSTESTEEDPLLENSVEADDQQQPTNNIQTEDVEGTTESLSPDHLKSTADEALDIPTNGQESAATFAENISVASEVDDNAASNPAESDAEPTIPSADCPTQPQQVATESPAAPEVTFPKASTLHIPTTGQESAATLAENTTVASEVDDNSASNPAESDAKPTIPSADCPTQPQQVATESPAAPEVVIPAASTPEPAPITTRRRSARLSVDQRPVAALSEPASTPTARRRSARNSVDQQQQQTVASAAVASLAAAPSTPKTPRLRRAAGRGLLGAALDSPSLLKTVAECGATETAADGVATATLTPRRRESARKQLLDRRTPQLDAQLRGKLDLIEDSPEKGAAKAAVQPVLAVQQLAVAEGTRTPLRRRSMRKSVDLSGIGELVATPKPKIKGLVAIVEKQHQPADEDIASADQSPQPEAIAIANAESTETPSADKDVVLQDSAAIDAVPTEQDETADRLETPRPEIDIDAKIEADVVEIEDLQQKNADIEGSQIVDGIEGQNEPESNDLTEKSDIVFNVEVEADHAEVGADDAANVCGDIADPSPTVDVDEEQIDENRISDEVQIDEEAAGTQPVEATASTENVAEIDEECAGTSMHMATDDALAGENEEEADIFGDAGVNAAADCAEENAESSVIIAEVVAEAHEQTQPEENNASDEAQVDGESVAAVDEADLFAEIDEEIYIKAKAKEEKETDLCGDAATDCDDKINESPSIVDEVAADDDKQAMENNSSEAIAEIIEDDLVNEKLDSEEDEANIVEDAAADVDCVNAKSPTVVVESNDAEPDEAEIVEEAAAPDNEDDLFADIDDEITVAESSLLTDEVSADPDAPIEVDMESEENHSSDEAPIADSHSAEELATAKNEADLHAEIDEEISEQNADDAADSVADDKESEVESDLFADTDTETNEAIRTVQIIGGDVKITDSDLELDLDEPAAAEAASPALAADWTASIGASSLPSSSGAAAADLLLSPSVAACAETSTAETVTAADDTTTETTTTTTNITNTSITENCAASDVEKCEQNKTQSPTRSSSVLSSPSKTTPTTTTTQTTTNTQQVMSANGGAIADLGLSPGIFDPQPQQAAADKEADIEMEAQTAATAAAEEEDNAAAAVCIDDTTAVDAATEHLVSCAPVTLGAEKEASVIAVEPQVVAELSCASPTTSHNGSGATDAVEDAAGLETETPATEVKVAVKEVKAECAPPEIAVIEPETAAKTCEESKEEPEISASVSDMPTSQNGTASVEMAQETEAVETSVAEELAVEDDGEAQLIDDEIAQETVAVETIAAKEQELVDAEIAPLTEEEVAPSAENDEDTTNRLNTISTADSMEKPDEPTTETTEVVADVEPKRPSETEATESSTPLLSADNEADVAETDTFAELSLDGSAMAELIEEIENGGDEPISLPPSAGDDSTGHNESLNKTTPDIASALADTSVIEPAESAAMEGADAEKRVFESVSQPAADEVADEPTIDKPVVAEAEEAEVDAKTEQTPPPLKLQSQLSGEAEVLQLNATKSLFVGLSVDVPESQAVVEQLKVENASITVDSREEEVITATEPGNNQHLADDLSEESIAAATEEQIVEAPATEASNPEASTAETPTNEASIAEAPTTEVKCETSTPIVDNNDDARSPLKLHDDETRTELLQLNATKSLFAGLSVDLLDSPPVAHQFKVENSPITVDIREVVGTESSADDAGAELAAANGKTTRTSVVGNNSTTTVLLQPGETLSPKAEQPEQLTADESSVETTAQPEEDDMFADSSTVEVEELGKVAVESEPTAVADAEQTVLDAEMAQSEAEAPAVDETSADKEAVVAAADMEPEGEAAVVAECEVVALPTQTTDVKASLPTPESNNDTSQTRRSPRKSPQQSTNMPSAKKIKLSGDAEAIESVIAPIPVVDSTPARLRRTRQPAALIVESPAPQPSPAVKPGRGRPRKASVLLETPAKTPAKATAASAPVTKESNEPVGVEAAEMAAEKPTRRAAGRKAAEPAAVDAVPSKVRGRKPSVQATPVKEQPAAVAEVVETTAIADDTAAEEAAALAAPTPVASSKQRGRGRKPSVQATPVKEQPTAVAELVETAAIADDTAEEAPAPAPTPVASSKPRGRGRKPSVLVSPVKEQPAVVAEVVETAEIVKDTAAEAAPATEAAPAAPTPVASSKPRGRGRKASTHVSPVKEQSTDSSVDQAAAAEAAVPTPVANSKPRGRGRKASTYVSPLKEQPSAEVDAVEVVAAPAIVVAVESTVTAKPVAVANSKPRGRGRKASVYVSPIKEHPAETVAAEQEVEVDPKKGARSRRSASNKPSVVEVAVIEPPTQSTRGGRKPTPAVAEPDKKPAARSLRTRKASSYVSPTKVTPVEDVEAVEAVVAQPEATEAARGGRMTRRASVYKSPTRPAAVTPEKIPSTPSSDQRQTRRSAEHNSPKQLAQVESEDAQKVEPPSRSARGRKQSVYVSPVKIAKQSDEARPIRGGRGRAAAAKAQPETAEPSATETTKAAGNKRKSLEPAAAEESSPKVAKITRTARGRAAAAKEEPVKQRATRRGATAAAAETVEEPEPESAATVEEPAGDEPAAKRTAATGRAGRKAASAEPEKEVEVEKVVEVPVVKDVEEKKTPVKATKPTRGGKRIAAALSPVQEPPSEPQPEESVEKEATPVAKPAAAVAKRTAATRNKRNVEAPTIAEPEKQPEASVPETETVVAAAVAPVKATRGGKRTAAAAAEEPVAVAAKAARSSAGRGRTSISPAKEEPAETETTDDALSAAGKDNKKTKAAAAAKKSTAAAKRKAEAAAAAAAEAEADADAVIIIEDDDEVGVESATNNSAKRVARGRGGRAATVEPVAEEVAAAASAVAKTTRAKRAKAETAPLEEPEVKTAPRATRTTRARK